MRFAKNPEDSGFDVRVQAVGARDAGLAQHMPFDGL
jgi:hypothetical protein